MAQRDRTLQEAMTSLSPVEILAAAKRFFSIENRSYAAYPEQEGPGYLTLRGQGGEEVVFNATASGPGTRVSGSSYLFDQQIARFLSTLPPVAS
jgi:hypothetical protein